MSKKKSPELADQNLDQVSGGLGFARGQLEARDKMGNFEIQDLMSRYNRSEQLASSVQKKKDDTDNAVIGKIG